MSNIKTPDEMLLSRSAVANAETVLFAAYEARTFPGAQKLLMKRWLSAEQEDGVLRPLELSREEAAILHGAASWLIDPANGTKIHDRAAELGRIWFQYKPRPKNRSTATQLEPGLITLIDQQTATETNFQAASLFFRARQAAKAILDLISPINTE